MENLFVIIEGTDGAGKTTLCKNLAEVIRNSHPETEVLSLSFPDKKSFAYDKIREILKSKIEYPPDIVQSLFILNMIDCAEKTINPFFKESDKNRVLILDRSIISTIIYNTVKKGTILKSISNYIISVLGEKDINFDIINKLYCHLEKMADYTFFLIPPLEILKQHSKQRCSGEKNDKFDLVLRHQREYIGLSQYLCKQDSHKYISLHNWDNKLTEEENYKIIEKKILVKINI